MSRFGSALPAKVFANYGPTAIRVLGLWGYARYVLVTLLLLPMIIAQRSLRPVDKAMKGIVRLRHPLTGTRLSVDLDSYRSGDVAEGTYTFGLVREIWFRNVYLSHFRWPDQLDCIIDLGANRGIFALQACSVCRQVVAVEVLGKYAAPLRHNLQLNGLDNLHLVQAFIGGEGFMAPGDGAVIGLSDAIALAAGRQVDFMKIDIEGSEFGLDLAPLATVKRLAMEIHPRWGDPHALIASVRALGFDCRLLDDSMRVVAEGQAAFVYAVNSRFPEATWR